MGEGSWLNGKSTGRCGVSRCNASRVQIRFVLALKRGMPMECALLAEKMLLASSFQEGSKTYLHRPPAPRYSPTNDAFLNPECT